MESFLQIAPHSLAIVLSRVGAGEAAVAAGVSESDELPRHHTGYEIFADFKAENTQHHVWNQRITEAVSEIFFLGWIDEHVLLIQGKEDHLEVLREGWMRRSLNPPRGFSIKYLADVVKMKKTNSSTLRRAWSRSDLRPTASVDPRRSRCFHSVKDYTINKHRKRNLYPPQYLCQSSPAYIHKGAVHQQIQKHYHKLRVSLCGLTGKGVVGTVWEL
uniref:Uncharacterized protein n=1 Tax=Monopterus albus TaxID=43700 RepID=A0A3Q3IB13_MONAL